MDLEVILQEEGANLVKAEAERSQRLEQLRKIRKVASQVAWQEALPLVAATPEERKEWATTIERDSATSVKQVPPSINYQTGVPDKKNPTLYLIKLLAAASKKSNVSLPKAVLLDLQQSGLGEKYAELLEMNED